MLAEDTRLYGNLLKIVKQNNVVKEMREAKKRSLHIYYDESMPQTTVVDCNSKNNDNDGSSNDDNVSYNDAVTYNNKCNRQSK